MRIDAQGDLIRTGAVEQEIRETDWRRNTDAVPEPVKAIGDMVRQPDRRKGLW